MKKLLSFMILILIVSVSFAQLSTVKSYTKTQSDARYERYLGNPSVSGYVLSSTTSGVRTWISNGSGGSMVYPAGSGIPIVLSGSSWTTTITDNHLNWDKYNQWDGGSTGLNAATGRTSLGGTTIGQSIFTVANPSAITFLRVNANNTASLLDASSFRTAIGAGTSSTNGTVTSVALSVPTGLSISGSPITASGTLALTLTSGYTIPSTASITNATTAYSWGNWASNFGTTTGTITQGNDSRLSDARTPTAHNQAQSTITSLSDSLISKYTRSQSDRRYNKVSDNVNGYTVVHSIIDSLLTGKYVYNGYRYRVQRDSVSVSKTVANAHAIAYWKMDETTGTSLNDEVANSDLTLSGGVVNQTGKISKAVLFDTNTDYSSVAVNSTLTNYTDKLTFRCWVKLNTLPSTTSQYQMLTELRNSDGTYAFRARLYPSAGYIRADFKNNSGTLFEMEAQETNLSTGVWYHIVIVNQGAGLPAKVYVNGTDVTLYNSANFSGTIPAFNQSLFVGNEGVSDASVIGTIDEVGFYNVVWSSADVLDDWHLGNGRTY